MRRRLRRQRRLRETLLLDLGALVYELHRQGTRAPELLQEKAAELTEVDDDVRALEAALAGEAETPDSVELPEQPMEPLEPGRGGEPEPAAAADEPAAAGADREERTS
jgi:hypothetical protein